MKSWIKLSRKLLEWQFYSDPLSLALLVHLLLKAEYEPKVREGVQLQRGQVLVHVNQLPAILGSKAPKGWTVTRQMVRTRIDSLCDNGCIEIDQRTTNHRTIITICNYDRYQVAEDGQVSDNNQPTTNQQPTNNQPTTNLYLKERKNIRKEENNNTREPSEKEIQFERFWTMYGKSRDKAKCRDKFLRLSDVDIGKIFETLPAYIQATPDKQYRRDPATYLNNRSWENEIIFDNNNNRNNGRNNISAEVAQRLTVSHGESERNRQERI